MESASINARPGSLLACEPCFGYYGFVKFRLLVEYDPQTQRWSAVFPELPGCASAGDTEQEAIQNAKEALQLWFEPSDLALKDGARLVELSLP